MLTKLTGVTDTMLHYRSLLRNSEYVVLAHLFENKDIRRNRIRVIRDRDTAHTKKWHSRLY
ncbi:hypothetical protein [Vagococcus acidifermentans]|uniref:Uncharacterized protein n=1 Tax=Vagococcus acidifermentans TaxID=564710 RepID=A0A430ATM7_9ENTE|nr:hypothetical protein [Vagococcus acidifermentans]RSU11419.1 hypothetical protein CBF27_07940 [Vagococcus acidifermentans]